MIFKELIDGNTNLALQNPAHWTDLLNNAKTEVTNLYLRSKKEKDLDLFAKVCFELHSAKELGFFIPITYETDELDPDLFAEICLIDFNNELDMPLMRVATVFQILERFRVAARNSTKDSVLDNSHYVTVMFSNGDVNVDSCPLPDKCQFFCIAQYKNLGYWEEEIELKKFDSKKVVEITSEIDDFICSELSYKAANPKRLMLVFNDNNSFSSEDNPD
jgi:hypothetical protein